MLLLSSSYLFQTVFTFTPNPGISASPSPGWEKYKCTYVCVEEERADILKKTDHHLKYIFQTDEIKKEQPKEILWILTNLILTQWR